MSIATAKPTPLQAAIDQAIAHLVALRGWSLCKDRRIDHEDFDAVSELGDLGRGIAEAADGVMQQIGYEAGVSPKGLASEFAATLYEAFSDNLGAAIRSRADDLRYRASPTARDPNDEHRLTKRELV